METINARIRNCSSPITNTIALMETYQESREKDQKRKALELLLKNKGSLEWCLEKLIEIN